MSEGFKINIAGLELFKKSLKASPNLAILTPSITSELLKFHTRLEQRVKEVYTVKQPLSSVLIGRDVKPSSQSSTFLRFSVQYRHKPVPMSDYLLSITPSPAISFAPPIFGITSKWKEGKFSKKVSVEMVRGKKVVTRAGKDYKRKGFILDGKVYARDQRQTWLVTPKRNRHGTRAKISQVFGLPLSELAQNLYDKDSATQLVKQEMETNLINIMSHWYSR